MKVSAQVSLYPLREYSLSQAIAAFHGALRDQADLEVSAGPMSTMVIGECSRVFAAVSAGYERVVSDHQVVLVMTISNACPVHAGSVADVEHTPPERKA